MRLIHISGATWGCPVEPIEEAVAARSPCTTLTSQSNSAVSRRAWISASSAAEGQLIRAMLIGRRPQGGWTAEVSACSVAVLSGWLSWAVSSTVICPSAGCASATSESAAMRWRTVFISAPCRSPPDRVRVYAQPPDVKQPQRQEELARKSR
ncbi:hypothetical protein D3C87_1476290 [compost metagenome]